MPYHKPMRSYEGGGLVEANPGTEAREKRAKTHSNTLEASEKKMKSMLQSRKWFGGGKGHSGLGNFGVSDKAFERQRAKVRAARRAKIKESE